MMTRMERRNLQRYSNESCNSIRYYNVLSMTLFMQKHTLELACQLIGIYQEKIASFGQMSQVPLSFSRYKQFYDAIRPSLVEVIQGGAHSPCEVCDIIFVVCQL